jgi:hypothetical protein
MTEKKIEKMTKIPITTEDKKLMKAYLRELRELHKRSLDKMHKHLERHENHIEEGNKQLAEIFKRLEKSLKENAKKMSSMEETFLVIYTNIKQNQFLYAHYPEEWDRTYLQMKANLKKENTN